MKKRVYFIVLCLLILSILVGCKNTMQTNEVNSDSQKQTFTIHSEDGNTTVNIDTTKEENQALIEEITIIHKDVTINTIDDIVGYYDGISLDSEMSRAIISYYGRKWVNFLLLDTTNGDLIFYEPFSFADVISAYQDNNNKMKYEINENDVLKFSCDKIIDDNSIQISYQVYDNKGNLQSGNFKYIISKKEFYDLKQNEPKSAG